MAQPIHCDVHGQDHLADVLVSQLATGDTMAACSAGYLELCRAYVEAAEAAEREATDAAALDQLAGTTAEAAPEATVHVVKRGTSRSRRAYEARRAAAEAEGAPEADPDVIGRPGPSYEPTEDAGEVADPA